MKKILIIKLHPYSKSFNYALAAAYKDGAQKAGVEVEEIAVGALSFNPNLQSGYEEKMELEPDLLEAWEKIKRAEHLVFFMPIWWGGMPALAKGFFDRLFLPGMAFKFNKDSKMWSRLLKGKTAHIVATMNTPAFVYRYLMGNVGIRQLKNNILLFCGVKTTKVSIFSPIEKVDEAGKNKYLVRAEKLGFRLI